MSNRDIKIILTAHAQKRCLERGVNQDDIENVIRNPIQTIYDDDRKNYKSVGKIGDKYRQEETYLVVIHTKEVDRVIKIISVMFTNQRGLVYYGFSDL